MKNAGYEIKLLNTFEDENETEGVAFGKAESPEAAGQYVTWEGHIDETGAWRWYWGHYFSAGQETEAKKDFGQRVKKHLAFRGLTADDGKIALRRWSMSNPWIDFVVIVDKADHEAAKEALERAYDEYWTEGYEAYGDAVIGELWDAGIPHLFHGQNAEIDGDDPEFEAWYESLDMDRDNDVWEGRE